MSELTRPRIHWVSPLPPAETDIAHYTARILPELTERADVVLWTDAPDWDRSLEDLCPVRRLNPDRLLPVDFPATQTLSRDEAVFIHIGNSWVFHSGFLRLARRVPSVVVLHDLAIQELCLEAIHNELLRAEGYRSGMRRWYGPEGAALADRLLSGKTPAYDAAATAPGFEIALDCAAAALIHTGTAFEAVRDRKALPCYQLNLPFRASPTASAERALSGPLKFAQFGYIGPNRRLEQVLQALSELAGEIDFTFDILGNVWDPGHIGRRIDALGLQGRVTIHGFVNEPVLDAMLAQAHLIFNLRHPTMGEASGSQLRIWNAAAASVVTNQGWYGSIPEKTAFQISVENEKSELQALVRALAADRRLGHKIGWNGRERLLQAHGPALYADGLVAVARSFGHDAGAAMLTRSARQLLSKAPVPSDLLHQALAAQLPAPPPET